MIMTVGTPFDILYNNTPAIAHVVPTPIHVVLRFLFSSVIIAKEYHTLSLSSYLTYAINLTTTTNIEAIACHRANGHIGG